MRDGDGRPVALDAASRLAAGTAVERELTHLLDHYEQPLFGYLVVLLGDSHAAQDCTQETFIKAYQHLQAGKSISVQWLYTVARSRAIDEMRRRKRQAANQEPLEDAPAPQTSYGKTLAVRRALAQLHPDDREILYLAEVDGFTSIEIGAMMGVRPGTARMRLWRAHLRFRRVFEEER